MRGIEPGLIRQAAPDTDGIALRGNIGTLNCLRACHMGTCIDPQYGALPMCKGTGSKQDARHERRKHDAQVMVYERASLSLSMRVPDNDSADRPTQVAPVSKPEALTSSSQHLQPSQRAPERHELSMVATFSF